MSARLVLSLTAIVWSTFVWTELWADLSVANVLWGAVLGAVTLLVLPVPDRRGGAHVSLVGVVRYLGHLAVALVESSAAVAWEVITPTDHTNPAIVAVPLRTGSDLVAVVVANTITLTPGTVTLELDSDPFVLYVHVLHLTSVDQVREDVLRLEEIVLRAFPDAPAAADPPRLPAHLSEEESP